MAVARHRVEVRLRLSAPGGVDQGTVHSKPALDLAVELGHSVSASILKTSPGFQDRREASIVLLRVVLLGQGVGLFLNLHGVNFGHVRVFQVELSVLLRRHESVDLVMGRRLSRGHGGQAQDDDERLGDHFC